MEKEFVVVFLNLDSNKVGHDCFMAKNEGNAVHSFHECYRHASYKIPSVVPTGRY